MSNWEDLFKSFDRSVKNLTRVLKLPKDEYIRDSAIKRFEITYELSWKLLQQYLREQGFTCLSPRTCFEHAYKVGLIKDDQNWIIMMNDRNSAVHTYNDIFAEALYNRLKTYLRLFKNLINSVKK